MSESALQLRAIDALAALGLWAIPNRVVLHRGAPTGLGPGSPDLVVVAPDGVAGWIEMKTEERGSRLDVDQIEWHRRAALFKHHVHVARTVEQAVRAGLAIRGMR